MAEGVKKISAMACHFLASFLELWALAVWQFDFFSCWKLCQSRSSTPKCSAISAGCRYTAASNAHAFRREFRRERQDGTFNGRLRALPVKIVQLVWPWKIVFHEIITESRGPHLSQKCCETNCGKHSKNSFTDAENAERCRVSLTFARHWFFSLPSGCVGIDHPIHLIVVRVQRQPWPVYCRLGPRPCFIVALRVVFQ